MLNIDKISYSIGQVSEITEIAQSTLRYWETVVFVLDPHKTDGGSRRYYKKDVEMVLTIKDLLYNQGFTIKGANQFLNKQKSENFKPEIEAAIPKPDNNSSDIEHSLHKNTNIEFILRELKDIKNILE
ncbi:MAG: MerR family transcriptional regulator [Calditrichaeota bacterium]|nr:MAG: MerR family transcriptional regulator [Calditrichota bacterium]MBL1204167.1 MerR family transcriptional regulator [Calditrichota bacterium]NOG43997.1 MerR family transcriptional regulator [Calditrichota bacterium]